MIIKKSYKTKVPANSAVTVSDIPTSISSYDFTTVCTPNPGFSGVIDFYIGETVMKTDTYPSTAYTFSFYSPSTAGLSLFPATQYGALEDETGVDGSELIGKVIITNQGDNDTLCKTHFMKRYEP